MEQASAVLEEHGNQVENGQPVHAFFDEGVFHADNLKGLSGGRTPLAAKHGLQHGRGMPAVCHSFSRVWLTSSLPSVSLTDDAKRWFECATVLCRFVPDGRIRAEKVCPTATTRGVGGDHT